MTLGKLSTLAVLVFSASCLCKQHPAKPQMGWNTWNTFKFKINQTLIEKSADSLVGTGLANVGYNYVLMDDGWQAWTRDTSGRQQANATTFPTGIPSLSKYVHKLGLKLGIYSDAGIYDCGFYPGSYGYEELDAQTYADWGVDYLKYDNCGGFHANTESAQERFSIMGNALKNTGHEIFYSLCQWGNQFPWFWADQISDSYRISGDIYSSFRVDKSGVCRTAYCLNTGYAGVSVLTIIRKMREISTFQGQGSWADMDMLEVGTGNMTEFEEQTHFSFWAALKSPLIIGADVNTIANRSLNVLLNKEIIAISQDDAGTAISYLPDLSKEGSFQIWGGPLSSKKNEYVVLALNEGTSNITIDIPMSSLPNLKDPGKKQYKIRDVWGMADVAVANASVSLKNVQVHQTKVLVFSRV